MRPSRWRPFSGFLERTLERGEEANPADPEDTTHESALKEALSNFFARRMRELGVFETSSGETTPASVDEEAGNAESESTGERIGPYRILRQIARGGMGTVLLAARDDDAFRRHVAIKLIQAGIGSPMVSRRFHSERQILANLDHPNIARLLDGGTTSDGRPYLVMEYVDGVPIDTYCDRHRLSLDSRLDLLRKVCTAVSYAHQNLVVHRDIKPRNILITEDGEPKLLDFGIAKVLLPESFGLQPENTQTGVRPMTPRYASPEQVRGEAIGTASDTYSLGVLLYELLIGRSPYRLESDLPHEIERAICEQEANRPSSELRRLKPSEELETLSERRGSRPSDFIRRLQGDLDHIATKALRKDPSSRYGSVEQLSEDLRRHLASLPVSARRGSLAYRTTLFARRHRIALGIFLAVSAITILFVVTLVRQAQNLERQRQRSDTALEFLVDIFKVSEPGSTRGEAMTAKRILETGGERVLKELEDQPEVQATLMDAIGRVYFSLGLYEQAAPFLEQALDRRRLLLGETHLEVASTLQHLAELRFENGEYENSEALFREALRVRRKLLGYNHVQVANTLDGLATALRWAGKLHGSEGIHLEALEIRRQALGPSHPKVAQSLDSLASLHYRRGEYDRAEELFRQAASIQRETLGNDHPLTVMSYKNVGVVLGKRGDLDPALKIFEESVAALRSALGPDHPWVAQVLQNLTSTWTLKGNFEEAEAAASETYAIQKAILDPRHPDLIQSMSSLGYLQLQKGEPEEAESLLEDAMSRVQGRLGQRNMVTASLLQTLAAVRLELGQLESAENLYLQAMEIVRAIHHDDHVSVSYPLFGMGRLAMARHDPAASIPLFRRSLELRQTAYPENHWQLAQAQGALGASLAAVGRLDEAEPLLTRCYEEFERQFGKAHPRTLDALQQLTALYDAWGRPNPFSTPQG